MTHYRLLRLFLCKIIVTPYLKKFITQSIIVKDYGIENNQKLNLEKLIKIYNEVNLMRGFLGCGMYPEP